MNFYILDDDINIIKKLEFIIEEENLGTIVGFNHDSQQAYNEIKDLNPNIVLIDVLMPKLNGIALVKKLNYLNNIYFIMISQVSNKEMIGEAYDEGIEFFISKPIIKSEVIRVIENIKSKVILDSALNNISPKRRENDRIFEIKKIINNLGISGERGTCDLFVLIEYILENNLELKYINLKDIYSELELNYKTSTQRIRRALMKAMKNLATEGLEDYYSHNFSRYSNTLFGFSDVRMTMRYLKGESETLGSVNLVQFIDSLLILSNQ
jgi:two-component system response regulator YcbB